MIEKDMKCKSCVYIYIHIHHARSMNLRLNTSKKYQRYSNIKPMMNWKRSRITQSGKAGSPSLTVSIFEMLYLFLRLCKHPSVVTHCDYTANAGRNQSRFGALSTSITCIYIYTYSVSYMIPIGSMVLLYLVTFTTHIPPFC